MSPLIALMKDQVDALKGKGLRSEYISCPQSAGQHREMLRGIQTGEVDSLYFAPGRLQLPRFREFLKNVEGALFDKKALGKQRQKIEANREMDDDRKAVLRSKLESVISVRDHLPEGLQKSFNELRSKLSENIEAGNVREIEIVRLLEARPETPDAIVEISDDPTLFEMADVILNVFAPKAAEELSFGIEL